MSNLARTLWGVLAGIATFAIANNFLWSWVALLLAIAVGLTVRNELAE